MSDRTFNTFLAACILIVIAAGIVGIACGVFHPGNSPSKSPYGIGISSDGTLQPTTYGVGANGQPTVPIP